MAQCRFHPQSEAVAYCATCRARFCRRCGEPGKTCSLCSKTQLTAPSAAAQDPRCVNHAQTRTTKPCHDCGKPYCSRCLNWQGFCSACAPQYPAAAAPAEADPPSRRQRRQKPAKQDLSYTGGLNRHKGWRRRLTRLVIGTLVLAGVGWVLSFQFGVFKDFATQAGKTRKQMQGMQAGQRSADMSSMLQRLESGAVTDADVAETERLMARISNGEEVDTGQRDALTKLSRLYQQKPATATKADPQAQKIWALLSEWSNDEDVDDAPPTRPAASVARTKATTPRTAAAVPWKVSLLAPAAGAKVKGVVTVNARIEGQGYIDRVEFLVNGEWQGLSNRPPFTFDWDTQGGGNGAKTLEIVAYEPSGAKHSSRRVRVTVAN
jgi:hypothetical protein